MFCRGMILTDYCDGDDDNDDHVYTRVSQPLNSTRKLVNIDIKIRVRTRQHNISPKLIHSLPRNIQKKIIGWII